MLEKDLSAFFNIMIKYKDKDKLNEMHELMKSQFCNCESKKMQDERKKEDALLEDYKKSLEKEINNNRANADNSMEVIKKIVSQERVENMKSNKDKINKLKVLHVSDLHIVENDNLFFSKIDDILEKLALKVTDCIDRLDFVCVTGDIAQSGKTDEYKNFTSLFSDRIKSLFDKDIDIDDRILIIPGNHDLHRGQVGEFKREDWKDTEEIRNMIRKTNTSIKGALASEWHDKIMKKFQFYKNFEQKYIQRVEDKSEFAYLKLYDDINGVSIGFTGLNSSWSYDNKSIKDDEKIYLGYEQYNEIKVRNKPKIDKLDVNILLTHHPLTFFYEELKCNLLADFDFILCGHTHTINLKHNIIEGKAIEITGGSLNYAEDEKEKYPFRFHIIDIEKTERCSFYNITYFTWSKIKNEWIIDSVSSERLNDGQGVIKGAFKVK